MVADMSESSQPPLSDEQLRTRTEALLKAAESVSHQLQLQTERLAAAIALFDRDIIVPLREGLQDQ
jgi:hypothetical protein